MIFIVLCEHPVSKHCKGEKCACGEDATHKIAEEIQIEPAVSKLGIPMARHPYTAYVCCRHFNSAVRPYLPRGQICRMP